MLIDVVDVQLADRRIFLQVFCVCGWLMKGNGPTSVCDNPKCNLFGDVFAVNVTLTKSKPTTVV